MGKIFAGIFIPEHVLPQRTHYSTSASVYKFLYKEEKARIYLLF